MDIGFRTNCFIESFRFDRGYLERSISDQAAKTPTSTSIKYADMLPVLEK